MQTPTTLSTVHIDSLDMRLELIENIVNYGDNEAGLAPVSRAADAAIRNSDLSPQEVARAHWSFPKSEPEARDRRYAALGVLIQQARPALIDPNGGQRAPRPALAARVRAAEGEADPYNGKLYASPDDALDELRHSVLPATLFEHILDDGTVCLDFSEANTLSDQAMGKCRYVVERIA